MNKKRPQDQTVAEWLADFAYYPGETVAEIEADLDRMNRGQPSIHAPQKPVQDKPAPHPSKPETAPTAHSTDAGNATYSFVGHRTFSDPHTGGRLILDFADTKSGEISCMFFNVEMKRRRGPLKGKPYPGGQFWPPERGVFRKLWMQVVGEPPRYWSEANRRINARFKDLVFTGDITICSTEDGKPYRKLENLHVIPDQKSGVKEGCSRGEGRVNSGCTSGEEKGCSNPSKPNPQKALKETKPPVSESTLKPITQQPDHLSPAVSSYCSSSGFTEVF